jgi:hypothetical protein
MGGQSLWSFIKALNMETVFVFASVPYSDENSGRVMRTWHTADVGVGTFPEDKDETCAVQYFRSREVHTQCC